MGPPSLRPALKMLPHHPDLRPNQEMAHHRPLLRHRASHLPAGITDDDGGTTNYGSSNYDSGTSYGSTNYDDGGTTNYSSSNYGDSGYED